MNTVIDAMTGSEDGTVFTVVGYSYEDREAKKGVREFISTKRAKSGEEAGRLCRQAEDERGHMLVVVGVYEGFLANLRDSD